MIYMGSKNKIAKELLPIILKDRTPEQYYIEPFCGGCNIIDKVEGNRIANDIHTPLIEMFKSLILKDKDGKPQYVSKELYNYIKDNKQKYSPESIGGVGFVCSFRGKYFGGYTGKTITNSNIRDYQIEASNNILKQVNNLKGVIFKNESYLDLAIPDNSIIYCDPPYKGTTGYKDLIDYNIFWNGVKEKTLEGHKVYVSEYTAPDEFTCIGSKKVTVTLSGEGKEAIEKLFIYNIE